MACQQVPACGWTSTAPRPRRWAGSSRSAARCRRRWARSTSTTSQQGPAAAGDPAGRCTAPDGAGGCAEAVRSQQRRRHGGVVGTGDAALDRGAAAAALSRLPGAESVRRTGLRRVDRPGHGGDGAVGGEAAVRFCPAVDQPVAAGAESGAQAPWLLLSMLVVFLVLAALYESWSIPLAVMLVVPLGLLGAVAVVLLRACPTTCSSRSA